MTDLSSEQGGEPEVEEVQAAVHEKGQVQGSDDDVGVGTEEEEEERSLVFSGNPATKVCLACHVATTQMDVNQCPMCGNPFLP